MGRPRKPYFRESDGCWVSRFRGEYVKLARGRENEAEAKARFHELMKEEALGTPVESPNVTTAALFEVFLDWSSRHNEPPTYEFYRVHLQSFVDLHGGVLVRELKPYHVTRWLDSHESWSQGTRRCAITAVKRALNRAVDEGLISTNPLKKVQKPPTQRRDRVLSEHERDRIAEVPRDQAFRDFLAALESTGCRPGEVAAVTAAQVNLEAGTWTFRRHKTVKKTNRPRVVYLTPQMIELCRGLVARHPEGPIFRNSRGQPWSRNAIRCRFRRARQKLGLGAGVVAYTYRHTYATGGLEAGVPIATMTELMGHTSTQMISEHYGHLDQKTVHLREAARRAAGRPGDA